MQSIPLKSRDIIDHFIKSGMSIYVLKPDEIGRSKMSIYNSLLGYVKRHDNLAITVRMVEGEIVLINNEKYRKD